MLPTDMACCLDRDSGMVFTASHALTRQRISRLQQMLSLLLAAAWCAGQV